MKRKEHYWAILTEDTVSKNDYIFWGESPLSVKIKLASNPNTSIVEVNQGAEEWSWYTCTICSAFTMLMYNTGLKYTIEDVKKVAYRMVADKLLDLKWGARLKDAIDYVRKYNNEVSDIKVDSFRLTIGSEEHKEVGEKNFAIQYGFFSSADFSKDSQDDGLVSGVKFPKWGGHAVTDLKIKKTIDNYKGKRKFNQYDLADMVALKNNGVIFPDGYIFLKQTYSMYSDVSENSPFFPAIKQMNELGIMKGQDGAFRPKATVTREEMAIIISRALEIAAKK